MYEIRIKSGKTDSTVVIGKLTASGYFSYLSPEEQERVLEKLLSTGTVFDEATQRVCTLDSEVLYEAGIESAAERVYEVFAKWGLDRAALAAIEAQLPNPIGMNWRSCTKWYVSAMNQWIEENRTSDGRIYYEYSGNDTTLLCVTPDMLQVLVDGGALEIPAVPNKSAHEGRDCSA